MSVILRRLIPLLEAGARRRFWLATVAMLVLAGLEGAALVAVAPLMLILTAPGLHPNSNLVTRLEHAVGNPTPGHLALDLGLVTVVLFVVKDVLAIVVNRWAIGFCLTQESILVRRLMDLYLHGSYDEHLRRNSAEFIRTLTTSTRNIFSIGVVATFGVIGDGFSVAFVALILVVANPLIALCALAYFALVGLLYSRGLRRSLAEKVDRLHVEQARDFQTIDQALTAVKEIKVRGREDHYVDQVYRLRRGLVPAYRSMAMISVTPRYVIELAMVGATTSIAAVTYSTEPVVNATATLGLFLAGGARLLAPLNKLMFGISSARSVRPAVLQVVGDVEFFGGEAVREHSRSDRPPLGALPPVGAPSSPRIEVRDVWFGYVRDVPVLKGVDFTVEPGEAIGLVGGSGAGKSTMLDVLLGLLRPDRGEVLVDGTPIGDGLRRWRESIGYVPQTIALFDDTVRANVALGVSADDVDDDEVWRALGLAQLDDVVRALPAGLDTIVGEGATRLSGGQRQRLGVARALYHRPSVLMFDEATSALDNETEHRVTEVLESLHGRLTTITIAHRLSTVRRCDRVLYFEDGRLAGDGSFNDLAAESAPFARLVNLSDLGVVADTAP